MIQVNELRQKTRQELDNLLLDLRREQFNLRMQRGTGQGVRTSRLKGVKRDIARIKTIMVEQSRGSSA